MPPILNLHGRRPGRGLRPWLLLPKVFCVAVYFGSLVTANVLWWMGGPGIGGDGRLNLAGRILSCVSAPTAAGVFAFGVFLFLQHPAVFWKMRWLQVKAGFLAVLLAEHYWLLGPALRGLSAGSSAAVPVREITAGLNYGLPVTAALIGLILVLGRLKPRLSQP